MNTLDGDVLASLNAFEIRYDLPVVWSATPAEAAVLVESWAWWFAPVAVPGCCTPPKAQENVLPQRHYKGTTRAAIAMSWACQMMSAEARD